MAIASRLDIANLVREDQVRRQIYLDPTIFEAEMERIFAGTWVCLGHESELPERGDFKTDELAGRPILVTRHNDGEIHVLLNSCRHRGATVCEVPAGNGPVFRCPYHGWTYRTNGELVIVPSQEDFGSDFDPKEYGLRPVSRVATYRGFVFASLNPSVPDLEQHLGPAARYIDDFVDRAPAGRIQVRKPLRQEYPGNWKLQMDNLADSLHAMFTHQATFGGPADRASRPQDGTARPPGGAQTLGRGHAYSDNGHRPNRFPELLILDPAYLSALAEHHGPERARELALADTHLIVYPNLFLQSLLSHFRLVKPAAVNRTEIYSYPCDLVGAPRQLNEELARVTALWTSPAGEVQVDDVEAFSRVQRGMRADPQEWVLFKMRRGDLMSRGFYHEWAQLMSEEP